ncbi:unnamed protein product [Acanthosepion pharaonis]|uniref:Metalloendopeptidase n=1 Tax=Acanthosepion pharaonis TaxID=158019 RepID=A0A812AM71_ACAPH|nr:unnamed protein product [Sepia pharaonis]
MDNIKEGDKGNFEKLLPPVINTQNLSYDYNSIMHYGRSTFAIDRTKPTIVPLKKDVDIANPVSINCTFEAGYCGWKHLFMEPPAKINTWLRWSGGTYTDGTGPKNDHTIGTFEGHYLYSDAADRFLSIAKIQTPEFIAGDYCLIFWYHMYGKDMGSLRNAVGNLKRRWPSTTIPINIHSYFAVKVLPPVIQTQGLPYDYNSLTHYGRTSFSVDGKKPTIIPLKKGVTIGQRKGMSQLDIIQVQRFYGCKERKLIKMQPPGMVTPNCTFDSDLCGWTQVEILPPLKNNTWIRWRGETVNYHSGPVTDHTIKTFEGYYIYVNAFRNYNSVAKIQSPEIAPGTYCLTFWYHMYGRDMGSLFVNLVKNGIAWKIATLKGEQGNVWKQKKVFLQAPAGGKIEFEGIAGVMYRSDIAVDDVLLSPGKC